MDNSVYITLSRQLALFRDMEVTANNLANANSTGYNATHITFNTYLTRDNNQGSRNDMLFSHDIATWRDTSTGPIHSTGNPLDVAIQGAGYFVVDTPLGTRYTRGGNFQINGEGVLTTPEGYAVLDNSNQPITFPDDTTEVDIGEIGNIKVNGEDFGTLNLVQFENENVLEHLNGGLLKTDASSVPAEGARVMQGSLEGSNVKPVIELTHMIEVSRAVGNTARFIEVVYDLQRKAANTWAQQG